MLEIKGLTKTFASGVRALKGITLEVPAGGCFTCSILATTTGFIIPCFMGCGRLPILTAQAAT